MGSKREDGRDEGRKNERLKLKGAERDTEEEKSGRETEIGERERG